jgi:hypothetical protein
MTIELQDQSGQVINIRESVLAVSRGVALAQGYDPPDCRRPFSRRVGGAKARKLNGERTDFGFFGMVSLEGAPF